MILHSLNLCFFFFLSLNLFALSSRSSHNSFLPFLCLACTQDVESWRQRLQVRTPQHHYREGPVNADSPPLSSGGKPRRMVPNPILCPFQIQRQWMDGKFCHRRSTRLRGCVAWEIHCHTQDVWSSEVRPLCVHVCSSVKWTQPSFEVLVCVFFINCPS